MELTKSPNVNVIGFAHKPMLTTDVLTEGVVELMPGDLAVAYAGVQLKTLLGSCVSVILTDPRRTVGAMCHVVHVGQPVSSVPASNAYGAIAFMEMERRLQRLAINASQCEAYVYGGGNMFPHLMQGRHVGSRNADWVLDELHHLGIPVIAQSLGGVGYRKISWVVGLTPPIVETVFPENLLGNVS